MHFSLQIMIGTLHIIVIEILKSQKESSVVTKVVLFPNLKVCQIVQNSTKYIFSNTQKLYFAVILKPGIGRIKGQGPHLKNLEEPEDPQKFLLPFVFFFAAQNSKNIRIFCDFPTQKAFWTCAPCWLMVISFL